MGHEYIKLIVFIVTTVTSVAITFYLKDFLQKKSEYRKLKRKLEIVAGRNAYIVYTGAGSGAGSSLYKITDIDEGGVTIKNSLQTIFIPPQLLLHSAMIVPEENYEEIKKEYQAKEIEMVAEAMFQPLMDKMVTSLEGDLVEKESSLGASIEIRVIQILEDKGVLSQVSTAELHRLQQLAEKS